MVQLAQSCAIDLDAFYGQRSHRSANDDAPTPLLEMMSADGNGVRMGPEGLREETRKLVEAQVATAIKGDPMAQHQARNHVRRGAVVTANWEQEPPSKSAEIHRWMGKITEVDRSPHMRSDRGRRRW